MRRALLVIGLSLALCLPRPAQAGVAGDAGIITIVTLGTLGGLANTVTTLVYSLDDRSFEVPWIVASLLTSAICGSLAVSFAIDSFKSGNFEFGWVVGALFYGALAAVPGYWTIKSALAEADPGERFDAPSLELSPVDNAVDPMNPTSFTGARSFKKVLELGLRF